MVMDIDDQLCCGHDFWHSLREFCGFNLRHDDDDCKGV